MEPLSINKVHCRDVRYFTTAFKDWSCNVLSHLGSDKNQKAVKAIKESFNEKKHYLKLDLKSYYPRDQMFTLGGSISSKTHDVSNIEKPLIDVVFTPKFHGAGSMKGKNLNMDDKYIKKMSSEQYVGDYHLMEILVEIRELSDLDVYDL